MILRAWDWQGGGAMTERHREEVLNVVLATCLSSRGIEADPETILRRGQSKPDVIALFRGLRCGIEGKVADVAHAKAIVTADAKGRIEQGIAHLAIAVVYPEELRTTAFNVLQAQMNLSIFEFSVMIDPSEQEVWHSGGINEIVAELRRTHDVIVRDDVLQQSVDTLNIGLAEVASALLDNKGACDRLIRVLGIGNKSDASSSV